MIQLNVFYKHCSRVETICRHDSDNNSFCTTAQTDLGAPSTQGVRLATCGRGSGDAQGLGIRKKIISKQSLAEVTFCSECAFVSLLSNTPGDLVHLTEDIFI